MSEQATPAKAPRQRSRANRRNFAKELDSIQVYCQAAADLLESTEGLSEFGKGQLAAFKKILARMEAVRGK